MKCPDEIIRVATIASEEMRISRDDNGDYKFDGLVGRYLEIILKALDRKFVVFSESIGGGFRLPNGTWTGLIGEIQKDNADLALYYLTVTEERTRVVDFSTVYATDDAAFAIEKPGALPRSMSFVYSFDATIWIFILFILFLMPLVFQRLLQNKYTYTQMLLSLVGLFFGKSSFRTQHSCSFRILVYSWSIFGMILMFSYSDVLLSVLTVAVQIPVIKTFEELSEAVAKHGYKCFTPKNSACLNYLLDSEKKHLSFLGETSVHHEWFLDHLMSHNNQISKTSAVLASRSLLEMLVGAEDLDNYYISEEFLVSFQFAIALKKNFCLKKKLNKIISRLNSAGFYLKILKDVAYKILLANHKMSQNTTDAKPLSVEDLFGIFMLLLVGLGLSLFSFICEVVCFYLKKFF
ncbi:uncharacterized protein CDAR_52111 [Caerostris darwini]|uniref:Uncharacterized protein n=1 Tax=Caerostris darwini TaxID=1538125 RepID=A0AAV4NMK5_9ARAC|nr:uncharacterized protein CDAR_52111 [Caerostris darwini]